MNRTTIEKEYLKKGYSVTTSRSYSYWIVLLYEYYNNKQLEKITLEQLKSFIDRFLDKRKKYSNQSINMAISAIKIYYKEILLLNIYTNSLKRRSTPTSKPNYLNEYEIIKLINCYKNEKHKLIITLIYSCAISIKELIEIELDDLNLTSKFIRIYTNDRKIFREVSIGKITETFIKEYLEKQKPKNFLIESLNGQYSARSVQNILKRAGEKSGLNKIITSKTLKYSHVKHLNKKGYSLRHILSNTTSSLTLNYRHYCEAIFEENIEPIPDPLDVISSSDSNNKMKLSAFKELNFHNQSELIKNTPYLSNIEKENSIAMASVYAFFHCFENSVRNLITTELQKKYEINWWNEISNKSFEEKIKNRKSKEAKNKWLKPRSKNGNPLYYLDWGDLLKIIRKKEELFLLKVDDLKFFELRFLELEKFRNIIAHSGTINDPNNIERIRLYFIDWIKQFE